MPLIALRSPWRHRIGRLVLAAAVCAPIAAPLPARSMDLFASVTPVGPGMVYPRFSDMVDRYVAQYRSVASACVGEADPACEPIARWSAVFDALSGMERREQLDRVNAFFNEFPYVEDSRNWGAHDYWATPFEFLEVSGDCEDFAVAKYYTLRGLGFDVADLRIVIVRDERLHIEHAVLAVDFGDDVLVLDNMLDAVTPARQIRHYTPLASISELGIWLHAPELADIR